MKKVKFTGKLSLNKETIAKLNDEQMVVIKGGGLDEAERSRRSHCPKRPCMTATI
jgi:natural product precursor